MAVQPPNRVFVVSFAVFFARAHYILSMMAFHDRICREFSGTLSTDKPHTRQREASFGSIVALLRTAVRSGKRGLLKEDSISVQRHLACLKRAYETALQLGLSVSLTAQQCAYLDDYSHKIELLRVDLETRLTDSNQPDPEPR